MFNIFDVLTFDLDCRWLRTLVFIGLMVRPASEHTEEKTNSIMSADIEQSELRVQHIRKEQISYSDLFYL